MSVPVPPAPPALAYLLPNAQPPVPAWIKDYGGLTAWMVFSKNTRLAALCFDDNAGPLGWQQVPMFPDIACYRPDLRTAAGQRDMVALNAVVMNNATFERYKATVLWKSGLR